MYSFNVIMASVRGHGTRSSNHHGNASHLRDNNNNKAAEGANKIDSAQPPFSDSFGSLESSSCGPLSPPSGDGNSDVAALRGGDQEESASRHEGHEPSTSSESDSQHNPWSGFIRFVTKPVRLQSYSSKSSAAAKKADKINKNKRGRPDQVAASPSIDADLCRLKPTWKNFPLIDLQKATNNFNRDNLIGQGGYAEVYKGELQDGQFVAIKKLTKGSAEEMTMDYLSELGIIAHVDHPNIAKLIGYGVEGGMHLILQLSPHGSLSSLLYGPKEKLSWYIRFKVAVGTAKGLIYLHEGCQRRIIHKDIKSANILLTEDFDAQIADFGLAKWLPDQWSHLIVSHVEGTIGYLPPEFFMHGIVDEKTDVFAYGVLLLELITGKPAIDSSQKSVIMWAKPLIQQNKKKELVDPGLGDEYDPEQLDLLILTASLCTHHSPTERPLMKQGLKMLEGDPETLEIMREMQNLLIPRGFSSLLDDDDDDDDADDDDDDDDQDYNSTEYLNEMSLQLETPLEDESSDKDDEHEQLDDHVDRGSQTQQVHSNQQIKQNIRD